MSISSLIHANIHRVKEGARVLEDIARFILRDEYLFNEIRNLRHALKATAPILHKEEDLGGPHFKEDNIRLHLTHIVKANALRMQEALRVLEELSTDQNEKSKFKSLRYQAYAIHSPLYSKVLQFLKRDKLKGLYLIVDPDYISLSFEEISNIINQSPVNIIQFRNKTSHKKDFLNQALRLKHLLADEKLFIINDHLDIALDIADGVHLGQEDYPLDRARKITPDHFIIGISCHHLKEAILAAEHNASYISLGCLFETQSKKNTTATSLSQLAEIRKAIDLPICAIGGMNEDTLPKIVPDQVDMAAIISSVWQTKDPLRAIRKWHDLILN